MVGTVYGTNLLISLPSLIWVHYCSFKVGFFLIIFKYFLPYNQKHCHNYVVE
jgi:hypothetical protein